MIMDRGIDYNKHCFVYCGDDMCNCQAGPRGRQLYYERELRRRGHNLEIWNKEWIPPGG
jgi:hypothetical protein